MSHRRGRAILVTAAVASACTLAACGPIKVEGTLEGTAYSCRGAMTKVPMSISAVGGVLQTVGVRSGAPFSIPLSPGHYLVQVRGAASRVTIGTGATVHVILQPSCTR